MVANAQNITPLPIETHEPINGKAMLYGKLARVMGKVSRVPKSGFNDHFKYKFATDADISDLIRTALAEEGVAFFADMISVKQETFITVSEYQGRRQEKQSIRTKVVFEFTFACGDSGATKTCEWESEALDQQDKGINKAATAAVKYFLLKTFLISTGDAADDPDADDSEGKQPKKQERRVDTSKGAPQNGKPAPATPPPQDAPANGKPESLFQWLMQNVKHMRYDDSKARAGAINKLLESDILHDRMDRATALKLVNAYADLRDSETAQDEAMAAVRKLATEG